MVSQAFRSTSAVKWYEIKSCRWLDWSLFKTVLACLSAAGRPAACLASGSDTLVPCSRMTPLSKVCLIYFAHCLSRVPPCTQTLWSVHSLTKTHKKKTTSFCLHSNPHPLRSVDILKNILSEATSGLYVALPLWFVCDWKVSLYGRVLNLVW